MAAEATAMFAEGYLQENQHSLRVNTQGGSEAKAQTQDGAGPTGEAGKSAQAERAELENSLQEFMDVWLEIMMTQMIIDLQMSSIRSLFAG